jgi:hypothetical protein
MEVIDVAPVPAANGALGQAGFREQHNALRIEKLPHPESIAARTGAGGIVEGEKPRLQLVDAVTAFGAGKAGGEHQIRQVAIHVDNQGQPVREVQGRLEGFSEAQFEVVANLEAVNHYLDAVLFLLVQRWQIVEFADLSVDPRADEAGGAQFLEDVLVFPLAPPHHGSQEHEPAALGKREDGVHHLADGLRLQRMRMLRAVRGADTGKQQAQVVVDLGDGPDGGARVVRGRLLFDGNGWGQALDVVDVRLFHHAQELSRVGGE